MVRSNQSDKSIADLMGVTPGAVRNWMNGHSKPGTAKIAQLTKLGLYGDEAYHSEVSPANTDRDSLISNLFKRKASRTASYILKHSTLSTKEAAVLTKLAPNTIRNRIRRGELPATLVKNAYSILRTDALAMVKRDRLGKIEAAHQRVLNKRAWLEFRIGQDYIVPGPTLDEIRATIEAIAPDDSLMDPVCPYAPLEVPHDYKPTEHSKALDKRRRERWSRYRANYRPPTVEETWRFDPQRGSWMHLLSGDFWETQARYLAKRKRKRKRGEFKPKQQVNSTFEDETRKRFSEIRQKVRRHNWCLKAKYIQEKADKIRALMRISLDAQGAMYHTLSSDGGEAFCPGCGRKIGVTRSKIFNHMDLFTQERCEYVGSRVCHFNSEPPASHIVQEGISFRKLTTAISLDT